MYYQRFEGATVQLYEGDLGTKRLSDFRDYYFLPHAARRIPHTAFFNLATHKRKQM